MNGRTTVTASGHDAARARLERAGVDGAAQVLGTARAWMRTSLTADGWQHSAYAHRINHVTIWDGTRMVAAVRYTGRSGMYVVTTPSQ